MGNQQPSIKEACRDTRIAFLARNAVIGDGSLWKHPECVNWKIVYTSTTPELLEAKRQIAPEIFSTGVREVDTRKHSGRYPNAKPLYRLASRVDPIITAVKHTPSSELYRRLGLEDFGLWYLDDGCAIRRTDTKSECYRYMICVGASCSTELLESAFRECLSRLFGAEYGRIAKNNSKATVRNKTWFMPHKIAAKVLDTARLFGVSMGKLP